MAGTIQGAQKAREHYGPDFHAQMARRSNAAQRARRLQTQLPLLQPDDAIDDAGWLETLGWALLGLGALAIVVTALAVIAYFVGAWFLRLVGVMQ